MRRSTATLYKFRRVFLTFASASWLAAACGATNAAEKPISEQIEEKGYAWVAGQTEFMNHCASCHGKGAKGDGPVADLFKISLPDLTTLSANNDGAFPYYHVYRTIDGRAMPRAHGTATMPVWGDVYTEDRKDELGQRLAHGRIFEVIVYLQSLQEQAPNSKSGTE